MKEITDYSEYLEKFHALSDYSKREVCHFILFLEYYEKERDNYDMSELRERSN